MCGIKVPTKGHLGHLPCLPALSLSGYVNSFEICNKFKAIHVKKALKNKAMFRTYANIINLAISFDELTFILIKCVCPQNLAKAFYRINELKINNFTSKIMMSDLQTERCLNFISHIHYYQ